MVESGKSTTTEDLQRAVDRLLAEGADGAAIIEMVAERIPAHQVATPTDIVALLYHAETPPDDEADVIYEPGELPEGLIDLPTASKKYGIPVGTLRSWVRRGKLPHLGRVKAKAPGGGYIVTREADIEYCRSHPRKRGPKSFARS